MAKRFVISPNNIQINMTTLTINDDECSHLCALRKKAGDIVNINEYMVKIDKLSSKNFEGQIIGKAESKGILKANLTLLQCYLKSDKMEYVIQKAVELGVREIIPIISTNCVVKLDDKDKIRKHERLNKIATEAIGQCGRTDTVTLANVVNMEKIELKQYDKILVCHEDAKEMLQYNDIKGCENIAVIIGPEGGLTNKEVEQFERENNVKVISLGDRILRAETASVKVLSIVSYLIENRENLS